MQEPYPKHTARGTYASALIVAHAGMLRDALSALLSAMPEITMVAVTASLESALETAAQSCPSIVLLETSDPDVQYLAGVQALKSACPRTRIIALIEYPKEARACEKGAVDAALTKGVPPARLTETISELLRSPAETAPRA